MNSRPGAVGCALIMLALSACGGSGNDAVAPGSASGSPDTVILAYGRAVGTGDAKAMLSYIDPTALEVLSAKDRQSIESSSQESGLIELRDFGYDIVSQRETTLEVQYTGQRCSPEDHYVSGTIGEDGTPGTGTVVHGPVKCSDLSNNAKGRTFTAKFILVDGQWFATLPQLP